jgi:hypothetical protein
MTTTMTTSYVETTTSSSNVVTTNNSETLPTCSDSFTVCSYDFVVNDSTVDETPRDLYIESVYLNVSSIIDFKIELATSRGFDIDLALFPPSGNAYEFMDDSEAINKTDGTLIDFYDMGKIQNGSFGFDNLGTYVFVNETGDPLEVGGENRPAWVPPGTYRSEDWPGSGGDGNWTISVRYKIDQEALTVGKGSIRYCGKCEDANMIQ